MENINNQVDIEADQINTKDEAVEALAKVNK